MANFSHLSTNNEAEMVDIQDKPITHRYAIVEGQVKVSQWCADQLNLSICEEIRRVAQISGVCAAKQTFQLIPYCHQIILNKVKITITIDKDLGIFFINAFVSANAQTGCEMEAFTAAQIAGLTIYDMIKSSDPTATLGPFRLKEKVGGKSKRVISDD